jgi:hypothetical protein
LVPIEVSGDGEDGVFGACISVVELEAISVRDGLKSGEGAEGGSAEYFAKSYMFEFFEALLGWIIFDGSEFKESGLSDFVEFVFWEVRFANDCGGDFEGRLQDAGHASHGDIGMEGRDGAGAFDAEVIESFDDIAAGEVSGAALGEFEGHASEPWERIGFAASSAWEHQGEGGRFEPGHAFAEESQSVGKFVVVYHLLHATASLVMGVGDLGSGGLEIVANGGRWGS